MLYEIKIKFNDPDPGKTGLLLEVLGQIGVDLSSVVETVKGREKQVSFYVCNKRKAQVIKGKICKACLKGIEVTIGSLQDKDWKSKWTEDYKPFKITDEIKIIPYNLRRKQRVNKEKTIYIKTDIIFGSGLHETTRYMAEFIRLKRKGINSFLDIGTGTGLLSIIAAKYGAEIISCIDIDLQAVENASFNFKVNKVRPEYLKTMSLAGFRTKKTFSFVAANLLTRDLIDMKDKIISLVSPGKYLAVSGISVDNYKKFRKEFDNGSLKCLRVKKGKDWTGVLYKKGA